MTVPTRNSEKLTTHYDDGAKGKILDASCNTYNSKFRHRMEYDQKGHASNDQPILG